MALPQKAVAFYLQSCYSDRDNINGGSTMFRKKRFAAGKKAAALCFLRYGQSKNQRYRSKRFSAPCSTEWFPQIVGKDGTVHPPLTAQTVLLSFRLTGPDGWSASQATILFGFPGCTAESPLIQSPPLFRSLPSGTVQITAGLSLPRTRPSSYPPMRERPSVPLRRNFSRITGRSLAQSCPCVMTIRRRRATFI